MNKHLSEQLSYLRLSHVFNALEVQNAQPQHYRELSFQERLTSLLDEEITQREQRKIDRLVKQAKFRLRADPEQIDSRAGRGIEKAKVRSLLEGHWLTHYQNFIFTGATGCGKTFMGCALGHYFCQ